MDQYVLELESENDRFRAKLAALKMKCAKKNFEFYDKETRLASEIKRMRAKLMQYKNERGLAVAASAEQSNIPSASTGQNRVVCNKILKKPGDNLSQCLDTDCGQKFKTRQAQNRHMSLMHGFTWTKGELHCALCIKTFQTKEGFDLHKKERHDCPSDREGRMTTRKGKIVDVCKLERL